MSRFNTVLSCELDAYFIALARAVSKALVALWHFAWLSFAGLVVHVAVADDDVQTLSRLVRDVNVHAASRQFADAERAGKELIDLCETRFADNAAVRVIASSLVACVYDLQGRYVDGEPHLSRVLSLADRLTGPDASSTVQSLNLAALAYSGQGRFPESERLYKRALALEEEQVGAKQERVAICFTQLALVSMGQNRNQEAEIYHRRALDIREALPPGQGDVLGSLASLAILCLDPGRESECERLCEKAIALARRVPNSEPQLVSVLDVQATIHQRKLRWQEAEAALRHGLEITQRMALNEKTAFVAAKTERIAELYRLQHRDAEAEALLLDVLARLEREFGPKHNYVRPVLLELARLRESQRRYDDARQLVDRVVEIGLVSERTSIQDLSYRARLLHKLGSTAAALNDLRRAVKLAESQRTLASAGPQDRARVFAAYAEVFENLTAWQSESNVADAFLAAERGRARALFDQLGASGVDRWAGVPAADVPNLKSREAAARLQLAEAEHRNVSLRKTSRPNAPTRDAEELESQLQLTRMRAAFADAERDIHNASPAYRLAIGRGFSPPSLDKMHRWARERRALVLYYALGNEHSFVFVAGLSGDARVHELMISKSQAAELGIAAGPLTRDHVQQIVMEIPKTDQVAEQSARGNAPQPDTPRGLKALAPLRWSRQLSFSQTLVPAAVWEALRADGLDLAVIVPDGALAAVPFEALVTNQGEQPTYWLDTGPPIIYAPSAAVLFSLVDQVSPVPRNNAWPVLTVGDPIYGEMDRMDDSCVNVANNKARYAASGGNLASLPFSGLESSKVADACRALGPVIELRREAARESLVRTKSEGCRWIHLACHGLIDESFGNRFGALALSEGPPGKIDLADDGFLTLAEIYELPLSGCELAILSACQTNFGPAQRGEGMSALSRGFLVAGARRVVATSWRVDDRASAELVGRFCSELVAMQARGTIDFARALQSAKRVVRANERWRDPYYWAPFLLVGAP